jgi:phosphoglycerate dehydrogenase-like enzyme
VSSRPDGRDPAAGHRAVDAADAAGLHRLDWIAADQRRPAATRTEPDEIDEKASIIIAGIGRFGQVVNRMVQASGFKTVVLDTTSPRSS